MKCEIELHNLLVIPSADTPRIQESHIFVWQIICSVVEKILFMNPEQHNHNFNQDQEWQ
jgi:hypothetical protein